MAIMKIVMLQKQIMLIEENDKWLKQRRDLNYFINVELCVCLSGAVFFG